MIEKDKSALEDRGLRGDRQSVCALGMPGPCEHVGNVWRRDKRRSRYMKRSSRSHLKTEGSGIHDVAGSEAEGRRSIAICITR